MAKRKQFNIPDQFLTSLNEFSHGGFVLFTFDMEGNPVINSQFDTIHHSNSMSLYIENWMQAIKQINGDIAYGSLIQQSKKKN